MAYAELAGLPRITGLYTSMMCLLGYAVFGPWPPSAGKPARNGPLAGGLSVVFAYLAVNVSAIRAFRTGFRGEFRFWRHLLAPATAAVFFLFPLWGSCARAP